MTTTAPALRLAIVSDTICPWCFVGKRRLEAALPVLAAEGLTFERVWKPYQLNPDMPVAGVERESYRAQKFGLERSAQMDAQIAAVGREAGIEFRHDRMLRTPNTLASHVLIAAAYQAGGAVLQDRVVEALFNAYFVEGGDIGDPQVLAAIAAGAGLDAAHAGADGALLPVVAREDEWARDVGLNGVPSFLLEGQYLFSGAQPAETMVRALRHAASAIAAGADPVGG